MKQRVIFLAALAAALLLSGCGSSAEEAVAAPEQSTAPAYTWAEPDPNMPAQTTEPDKNDKNDKDIPPADPAAETAPTPPAPAPTPEPTVKPIVPGTYTGSDGSVLTIKSDLTATYKTTLTGTINGAAMTGEVTYSGTVDSDGNFTFTKATYMGFDITKLAAQNGLSDASPWQNAAKALYDAQN